MMGAAAPCEAPPVAPPLDPALLAERFALLQYTINAAERAACRAPGSTRLIAVSKTYPAETVAAAARLGQIRFGENRVQEAQVKRAAVPGLLGRPGAPLEWHLIGHLQANKARFTGGCDWVHSVDSLDLARRISQAATAVGACCKVLIQVNVADDPDKHGLAPQALGPLVESIQQAGLVGIALRGLMTIGRVHADASETRRTFAGLRTLCERVRRESGLARFTELSMGMSGDYQTAIAEGSTMVRVGSALFGARNYGAY
jgi:pyridoxal phosphate enzyme (YggS family)